MNIKIEKGCCKGQREKSNCRNYKKAEQSIEAMKVARKSMLKYNSSFTEGLKVQQ